VHFKPRERGFWPLAHLKTLSFGICPDLGLFNLYSHKLHSPGGTKSLPVHLSEHDYDRMGIVTAATAVYRAGKATLVTGTILVKVIFVTIMSYRNFSGISFYYIF
jgi:hypothetical protein